MIGEMLPNGETLCQGYDEACGGRLQDPAAAARTPRAEVAIPVMRKGNTTFLPSNSRKRQAADRVRRPAEATHCAIRRLRPTAGLSVRSCTGIRRCTVGFCGHERTESGFGWPGAARTDWRRPPGKT